MKIRYFLLILIGVYHFSSNASQAALASRYLYNTQANLEEFSRLTSRGMGTLAKRSLSNGEQYLEQLNLMKNELNRDQLKLLKELESEFLEKKKLTTETISTCDYRNIEHFKELERLKELKARGEILSFNGHKKLYILKTLEVRNCKQFATWMENFNEISV